ENSLAGFGGDSQYLRNQVRSTKFIEITDGWIMNLGGAGGHILGIGDDIRIIDRFFLGGTFLRGFEQSGVGPRDLITNDAVGGNWFYRGSVGLTFPLGLPNEFGIEGRVFSDAGSLGENDSSIASITDTGSLRMSVGAGLLWSSPLGPMNLDFARAIIKESFDQTEVFRFSVGTKF
ncbi:MAG: BamA/TamA family outer membrane protein, partial [Pseudomonadota bacterium]|nr:BamA/TamA family outer membrane protein [Pseudomonadota bacterium]